MLTVHSGNFSKAWRTPWGWSYGDRNMSEFYGILAFQCVWICFRIVCLKTRDTGASSWLLTFVSLTCLYFLQSHGHKTYEESTYCAHSNWLRMNCLLTFTLQCCVSLHFQTHWGFVCISSSWKYTSVVCSVQWHFWNSFSLDIHKWRFCSIPICHLTRLFCLSETNLILP